MPAHFTNGPAAGMTLNIKRYPVLLRVVGERVGCSTTWDALDQLDDQANRGEDIFVYRMMEKPARVHIDGVRNGRRFGEWTQIGRYELLPGPQPDDAILRDNAKWTAWCQEQYDRNCPDWAKRAVMP